MQFRVALDTSQRCTGLIKRLMLPGVESTETQGVNYMETRGRLLAAVVAIIVLFAVVIYSVEALLDYRKRSEQEFLVKARSGKLFR